MPTSGVQTFTLTAEQITKLAMLDIGALAIGESPTAEELTDALERLNMLISSLVSDGVYIHKRDVQSLTTTGGTSNYTLATGTARLLHMWFASDEGDTPITILDAADYDAIRNKVSTGLSYSAVVNYDTQPPTVDVYPTPDAQYTYKYRRTALFDSVTDEDQEIDFPQRGLDMIVKGLGAALAPSYRLPLEERMFLQQNYMNAKAVFLSNNTERHGQEIVMPKGVIIV
jgi:hypothetical protein